MIDGLKAKGKLFIKVFKGDELIDTLEEANLVVTLGKTNITKLLGGDASGLPITKIGLGTSGIGTTVADSSLTGSFTKGIESVTYPDSQSVAFHFDIDNTEANGMTIREFGLFNSANVLCARKVRDAEIAKTNVIRLVGSWTITVN